MYEIPEEYRESLHRFRAYKPSPEVLAKLADQGIHNAQLIRQGRRTLAQFPMSEDNWAAREGALCDQIGVAACDPGACKSIQFRANTVNAASSEQVKARIIENPPEVDQTAELTEDGGVCRTAMVPWVPPSEGGAVPNLSLDLSLRERDSAPSARDPRRDAPGKRAEISANGREVADARSADLSSADGSGVSGKSVGRGEPGAAEQTADSSSADDLSIEPSNEPTDGPSTDDPTTTEQAAAQAPDPKSLSLEDLYGNSPPSLTAADFQLRIAPDFSGAANLASDQLPADTSNYTLLVGEGCQASQVPLSSLAPARVPNLVVALVNWALAPVAENDQTEYVAYVSEQNLLPDESGEPLRHPQISEFFAVRKGAVYVARDRALN